VARPERVVQLTIPPHSVEAEQAVLGALLLDGGRTWPLVASLLTTADFYRADHRLIFDAIGEVARSGSAPDLVMVDAVLERRRQREDTGGFAYLGTLTRDTTGANAEHYARIVRERAQLRQLAEMGHRLAAAALGQGDRSAEQLAAEVSRDLAALHGRAKSGAGLVSAHELAGALVDDLDARREGATGLMTGLADFDDTTGGLEPGELTIFAGRPAMGKSALMVTIAAHVSRDKPVALFSAEMPALQLARRAAALLGNISQTRMRRPDRLTDEDWVRISDGASKFRDRKLWIDDKQLPPMTHIRAECIGHKARHGLDLVLIDYVQLVSGTGANRYEQLREVAYGAKALAKELSIPVVMLAQLNRGVEQRERKRPFLSDLRDSGSIEEAADIVGLLYREDYYDQQFGMPNVVECAIEKHRNGERGQCLWHFAGEFSRMTALDEGARRQYRHLVAQAGRRKGSEE